MRPIDLQRVSTGLLLAAVGFGGLAGSIPVQDSPRQRLLDGKPLPWKYRKASAASAPPYTPDHRDPYDGAVDSVGNELDPLPWRNGLGASVLGPWNRERSRQSPDLVRPPSTDHGNMPNLRWSFADSHMRIEVMRSLFYRPATFGPGPACPIPLNSAVADTTSTGGRLDPADYGPRAGG